MGQLAGSVVVAKRNRRRFKLWERTFDGVIRPFGNGQYFRSEHKTHAGAHLLNRLGR